MEQTPTKLAESAMSKLILKGDISTLTEQEKIQYYQTMCERLGIDPTTQPFSYLVLNGRQCLYLNKGGAEQLSKVHTVSHAIKETKVIFDHIYQVIVRAEQKERYEDATGSVNIKGLYGDALSNSLMKAETKAKRRSTLALLGLGMLDETEVETIPNAKTVEAKVEVLGEPGLPSPTMTISSTETAPAEQVTSEDWENILTIGKQNKWPENYMQYWLKEQRKKKKAIDVYQDALARFGQLNEKAEEGVMMQ